MKRLIFGLSKVFRWLRGSKKPKSGRKTSRRDMTAIGSFNGNSVLLIHFIHRISRLVIFRQLLDSPSFLKLEQDITDALKSNRSPGKKNGQSTKEITPSEKQETAWREAARDYRSRFVGHCNTTTDIKEAAFLGQNGDFIMAGSDDGSFFIWDRESTNLVKGISSFSRITFIKIKNVY